MWMEGRRGGTNGLGEIHEELRRQEAQLKFKPSDRSNGIPSTSNSSGDEAGITGHRGLRQRGAIAPGMMARDCPK
jgi:hypothetical protein